MACFHPLRAFRLEDGSVSFSALSGSDREQLLLPCGKCDGCRLERSRQWAVRCMHEAQLHESNCFVTLTYDDAHCPPELVPRDMQLFLKRLRKVGKSDKLKRDVSQGIRFFGSGEYGERTNRPHFHILLFNCDFSDKYEVGKELFHSDFLASVWTVGGHRIGEVTARSANYVAQYSMKKLGSRLHCDSDGVVRQKPFLRMSRRPGIGHAFVERYSSDLAHGFLVHDGERGAIPRAYKKKLDPEVVAQYEAAFCAVLRRNGSDRNDPARLCAGERIALKRADSHSL